MIFTKRFIITLSVLSVLFFVALSVPTKSDASSNVVLASVEWVQSQLNPVKDKVNQLESTIKKQQDEINSLRQALESGNPVTPAPSLPSQVFVNKPSATIHSGATRNYRVVATRVQGDSLNVIDTHTSSSNDTWYRVNVSSNLNGWIHSGDVSLSQVTVPTQAVTTTNTVVRRGATTDYASVESVSRGTTLKYIGSFTNNNGELWYNVETSRGNRGWVISTHAEVR
ncbi:SH3 domain-containing protein [Alkalihalobacillus deserti]|uniref:SH3 domain-containing protein n=1 Tax=Alkalihalobacillus deserti TaxID=2879466 RepID=UPI001D134F13|nr:SH3 domain-containing protein [Alkalihalobacillus deserti]